MGMHYMEQVTAAFLDELEKIGHTKEAVSEEWLSKRLSSALRADGAEPKRVAAFADKMHTNWSRQAKRLDAAQASLKKPNKQMGGAVRPEYKELAEGSRMGNKYTNAAGAAEQAYIKRTGEPLYAEKNAFDVSKGLRNMYERKIPPEDRERVSYEQWYDSIGKEAAFRPKA